QPHRIKYLDEVLKYIMSHDAVWQTTADEIAEYYIANYYDATDRASYDPLATGHLNQLEPDAYTLGRRLGEGLDISSPSVTGWRDDGRGHGRFPG
ncbi:MAG: hypothetical protein COB31_09875, partial [Erythrobacter sp.]